MALMLPQGAPRPGETPSRSQRRPCHPRHGQRVGQRGWRGFVVRRQPAVGEVAPAASLRGGDVGGRLPAAPLGVEDVGDSRGGAWDAGSDTVVRKGMGREGCAARTAVMQSSAMRPPPRSGIGCGDAGDVAAARVAGREGMCGTPSHNGIPGNGLAASVGCGDAGAVAANSTPPVGGRRSRSTLPVGVDRPPFAKSSAPSGRCSPSPPRRWRPSSAGRRWCRRLQG